MTAKSDQAKYRVLTAWVCFLPILLISRLGQGARSRLTNSKCRYVHACACECVHVCVCIYYLLFKLQLRWIPQSAFTDCHPHLQWILIPWQSIHGHSAQIPQMIKICSRVSLLLWTVGSLHQGLVSLPSVPHCLSHRGAVSQGTERPETSDLDSVCLEKS